jgi:hypothetical protein
VEWQQEMAWPLEVSSQQLSLFCVQKTQIRTKVIYGTKASYDYPYFRSGSFIVVECSGMVSRWPRRAGDGWQEMTLLPSPRMRLPAPRTPRGTAVMGSSTTTSSSAIFCLLGDDDVSSSSSVSSFVRGYRTRRLSSDGGREESCGDMRSYSRKTSCYGGIKETYLWTTTILIHRDP